MGLGMGPFSKMDREWAGRAYGGVGESKEKEELEEAEELELWRTGDGVESPRTGAVLRESEGRLTGVESLS
jgi:hypothetical protein